jgi:FkbM family methyltransferase
MAPPLVTLILVNAMSDACRQSTVAFALAHLSGFSVPANNGLKRITAQFARLRQRVLAETQAEAGGAKPRAMLASAQRPIVIDVGAAYYGAPEDDEGSDAMLVLKASDVIVDVHAFEMKPSMARALRIRAMPLLSKAPHGSNLTVVEMGIGAEPAVLRASPMAGTDKARTLTLSRSTASGTSRKGNAFDARITSLDVYSAECQFDRPIFYIKIDTNGHEPAVVQGMTKMLRNRNSSPLFISLEYGIGYQAFFTKIDQTLKNLAQGPLWKVPQSKRVNAILQANATLPKPLPTWPSTAEMRSMPTLHGLVALLSASGYAVYFTHTHGVVRIDGAWWHDEYELAANLQAKIALGINGDYVDFVAARHGPPQRAFEALFIHSTLPCITLAKAYNHPCTERPALSSLLPGCASGGSAT